MIDTLDALSKEVAACQICAEKFAATKTAHAPRPVAWMSKTAPVLIAGQAPGARVHASGIPFDDPSGDRLREWLGVDRDAFYDRSKFAILPMAYCFPGYDDKGSDLPPPPICAKTWRARAMAVMGQVKLVLLIGGYAQKWHLRDAGTVTQTVKNWLNYAPDIVPLPHPSWRNTGWIKKNPWFESELVPELQSSIKSLIHD